METIGPPARRRATGALRGLLWGREVPRPPVQGWMRRYGVPLGLFALIGNGLFAGVYLSDNRNLPTAAVVLLGFGSVLPAALAYRLPVLAWRLAFVMIILGTINQVHDEPWPWNPVQIFAFLLVLGRLASTQSSARTIWATAISLAGVFSYAPVGNAWGAAVLLVAIAALGDILSRRRRTGELLAEQEELTELERAKRAVLEERARIAREMHDVVAHHMSMIAVRAETAPYRVPDLPASAQDELATIATAARAALTDMRRLLGALRAEEDPSLTAPQPTLGDVDDLVKTARAAGVRVAVRVADVAEVPETVGLAAYRIVQEALANAARHAPGEPVTIEARGFAGRLELTVRNDRSGPAVEPGSGGHGVVGMRERATLLGGSLTAAPDESGFVVRAVLPLGEETPT